jgi:phosphate starvation-inducible PhoH-like protein
METQLNINFDNNQLLPILYGEQNVNIKVIERTLGVAVSTRGNSIFVNGERDVAKKAVLLLERLYNQIKHGAVSLSASDVEAYARGVIEKTAEEMDSRVESKGAFALKTRKKPVFPYTESQRKYVELLHQKDITFGIGAAGTGKTFLAVATAVSLFLQKQVSRIILTRPAVEAGEKLGFLPGDMKDKVDPYLRPLYDALYEMLPSESVERYFVTREFEIAPLAFMRGRTLSNSFIILDEAQNATSVQMKMFLTRLGYGSKMVITGDLTQIDLPKATPSGLIDAIERLKHLNEIGLMRFSSKDVVRHPLTSKIIDAYEQD